MKKLLLIMLLLGRVAFSQGNHGHEPHEMQHGFILADGDQFASHLVATGHHSRQVEVFGALIIADPAQAEIYQQRRDLNKNGASYFLLQAQKLDLPTVSSGQILQGHIIESKAGLYESKNTIVKEAQFKIEKVILNLENPFFKE